MADIQSKKEKERLHLKDQERKKRGRAGDKDNENVKRRARYARRVGAKLP